MLLYSLVGEVVLVDVSHDWSVGPGVLRVDATSAVGEDEDVEALVEPNGAAVAVQHVLAPLTPRLATLRVQHHLAA